MRIRILCAGAILFGCASAAAADELIGVISKIGDGKVTFKEGKKGAEAKTYDLSKDVKVYRLIKKSQKELDPDGLKAEPLPNLPKGGTIAVITVEDGKVTEISLPQKPKKN
jgi:hypothetical protein